VERPDDGEGSRIADREAHDQSLDVAVSTRRAVDALHALASELAPEHGLVHIHCRVTNDLGDPIAAFSIETDTRRAAPDDSARLTEAAAAGVTSDPELECVDNIPV
jgi:hypothetical protein